MSTSRGRTTVVITGIGVICPLGQGAWASWHRLLQGASGARPLPENWPPQLTARVIAPVPDRISDPQGGWDPVEAMPARELRRNDRVIALAMGAAAEALATARWDSTSDLIAERAGVVMATAVGGWSTIEDTIIAIRGNLAHRLSPFTVPAFLANSPAAQIAIRFGLMGPLGTPATACAAGLQAIGDAARIIERGEADLMVAGGAEACLSPTTQASFSAARSLSVNFNHEPHSASRPFDQSRSGFVPAEGAACVVLESLDHAIKRNAPILAEWRGYGTTTDAHHVTAPTPSGTGAARAMRASLAAAGIQLPGAIFAHATATPLGDAAEAAAIASIVDKTPLPVVATKAATGHLLGAAGALAAVWAICALNRGYLPPNRNLEEPDRQLPAINLIGREAVPAALTTVLVNAFGFGGVNASAVIGRAP